MAPEPPLAESPTVKTAVPTEIQTHASAAVQPHRLAANFAYLSAGEMAAKLLTFASFSYLARTLGPANYGLVEFTLDVMTFFTMPADMGLSWYGAREIARNPSRADRLLHEIVGLKVLLTLCSMTTLFIFILVIHKSFELKALLSLYDLSLLSLPFFLMWFFQAYDRMAWVGLASIVRQVGFAGLVFLLCHGPSSLIFVGVAECISVSGVVVFCLWLSRTRLRAPWPTPDLHPSHIIGHLREAAPIGLTELAWTCMLNFCTVLLGFLFPDKTLGWFGGAHHALMALHTFVYLYFFNLLPSIARCVALPHEYLLQLMDRSVRFTAWTGLFGAGLLTALAPQVMVILYGKQFRPAASSFEILVWMLPVSMLSGHHRFTLIAYGRQKQLMVCTFISAAAVMICGVILIPLFGGPGAAYALLIAVTVNFALVYFAVRRLVLDVPVTPQVSAPLIALAFATGIYLALARWNMLIALAAGCALYLGILARTDGALLVSFARTILRNAGSGKVLEDTSSV
jgi:O-antigen/teichoic acid export membrane protein